MKAILVSVIVATFNSGDKLSLVLKSLKRQKNSKRRMEILVVDGGSTDHTLKIAKKFHCRVINNPRTEPVYAKYLGYKKARGKYIMYLDHDEVLESKNSVGNKIEVLEENQNVKAVAGGNYVNPEGYPFINEYINEFGDPFSFFRYRLSKAYGFFIETMRRRYPVVKNTRVYTIFDLSQVVDLPIIELVAGGSMFDASYLKKNYEDVNKESKLMPHLYYLLHKRHPHVAVMKNDPIKHYSVDVLDKYLNKIKWRVKNNIYNISDMGWTGFTGREKFQPTFMRLKRYLFIPYALFFFFPLIDAIWLIATRRKFGYILHVPLTFYTALLIVYYYVAKWLGSTQVLRSYDEVKIITK